MIGVIASYLSGRGFDTSYLRLLFIMAVVICCGKRAQKSSSATTKATTNSNCIFLSMGKRGFVVLVVVFCRCVVNNKKWHQV